MTYDVEISVSDSSIYLGDIFFSSWRDLLYTTLRGSLAKSKSGNTHTFEDRYSGLEVELSKASGFVESLTVSGPVPNGGAIGTETVVDASFSDGALKAKKLLHAFNSHHNSSGENKKLENILDSLSYSITASDDRDVKAPVLVQYIKGGKLDDKVQLVDDLNSVTATLGNDMYIGGENIDFISYLHIEPGLKLRRDGDERIVEKANGDTDQLQGFEQLFGTEGNDKLKPGLGNDSSAIYGHSGRDAIGGGRKADLLDGGAGNDRLFGRGGDDLLVGGAGDDVLRGHGGDDVLFGRYGSLYPFGTENDTLIGGGGRDLFVIQADTGVGMVSGVTVIRDFKDGKDFLGLVGYVESSALYSPPTLDNLTYSDLSFRDTPEGTMISYESDDIALLRGVDADDLSRKDFVEAVGLDSQIQQFILENDFFIF